MKPSPDVRRPASRHRRTLLVAVAGLTVISMSPVFGHHIAPRAAGLFAGDDHVMGICLVALRELLRPVHESFHVLFAIGLTYATWDRIRAAATLRHAVVALDAQASQRTAPAFTRAAAAAGFDVSRIRVVSALPAPAFTAGWLRPRVFLSARLPEVLDAEQLTAVIAHEAAHARARDPLKLSALRFLANTLFYVPALRRLVDDLADEAEIAADDEATVAAPATRLVLASAILTLADTSAGFGQPLPAGAVGFQRVDLLERRIRHLTGESAPAGTRVTRASVGGAVAILIAVWISGLMMAQPLGAATFKNGVRLPAPSGDAVMTHCQHRGWAITHLFCVGLHGHVDAKHCPYAGR